jgi:hypothetical protein
MDKNRLKEILVKLMDARQKSTLVDDHGNYKVMFPYVIMHDLKELEDFCENEMST